MLKVEDLQPNAAVRGVILDHSVTVVSVRPRGPDAIEPTYESTEERHPYALTAQVFA